MSTSNRDYGDSNSDHGDSYSDSGDSNSDSGDSNSDSGDSNSDSGDSSYCATVSEVASLLVIMTARICSLVYSYISCCYLLVYRRAFNRL